MPPKRKYNALSLSTKWEAAKKRRSAARAAIRASPLRASYASRSVQLGRGPVPAQSFVTLKYHLSWVSDGTTIDKRFNLNSIYAPEYSGGHQPLGRDQYGNLYNRYRVWSTSVRVDASTKGSVVTPMQVTMVATNSSSSYTDFDTAAEQAGAFTKMVPANGSTATHFFRKYYLPAVNGQTKTAYKDDRFQATFGASPSEIISLHLVHGTSAAGVPGSGDLLYNITLNFYVELYDPLPLAQS